MRLYNLHYVFRYMQYNLKEVECYITIIAFLNIIGYVKTPAYSCNHALMKSIYTWPIYAQSFPMLKIGSKKPCVPFCVQ